MSPRQTRQELAAVTAAQAAGVSRVVKLSVWRAPDRLSPIAELHRPSEEALEASALAWTFLRPNRRPTSLAQFIGDHRDAFA